MRIEIVASAKRHQITDAEIRAAVTYPQLSLPLTARRPGSRPYFYTAPAAANQPWIEVIADLIDPRLPRHDAAAKRRRCAGNRPPDQP